RWRLLHNDVQCRVVGANCWSRVHIGRTRIHIGPTYVIIAVAVIAKRNVVVGERVAPASAGVSVAAIGSIGIRLMMMRPISITVRSHRRNTRTWEREIMRAHRAHRGQWVTASLSQGGRGQQQARPQYERQTLEGLAALRIPDLACAPHLPLSLTQPIRCREVSISFGMLNMQQAVNLA